MGRSNIAKALEELSKTDVYSMILFILWKLSNIPEYATLSELSYVMDGDSLIKFLNYYGGRTIKVPTKEEFKLVIEALLLYQSVNIEGQNFKDALNEVSSDVNKEKVKEIYIKINDIMSNYNFNRN